MDTNIEVWSQIEVGIAIVAACLPTLGPLITERASPSILRSAPPISSWKCNFWPSRKRSGETELSALNSKTSRSLRGRPLIKTQTGRASSFERVVGFSKGHTTKRTDLQEGVDPVDFV